MDSRPDTDNVEGGACRIGRTSVDKRKLDWSRLPVFAAVARTGSINAAASELAVSAAKVSRDLTDLERVMGRELFVRSARGVALTDFGALVLNRVETMTDTFGALAEDVDLAPTDDMGTITIAAYDCMATYWLARRLPEFHRSNPGIQVTLKVVEDTADLLGGEADIAIQYEQPKNANIFSKQVGWSHYIPCASRGYLNIFGTPESMFDAGKHRVLSHLGYRMQKEAWPKETPHWQAIVPKVLQTNSGTVIVEDCASDGGIAVLPSYIAAIDPRLVVLNFRPLASLKFWLTYTETTRENERCQPVLAWLRDCFNTARHPWFREAYVRPPTAEELR